jgi:hypothetical protein
MAEQREATATATTGMAKVPLFSVKDMQQAAEFTRQSSVGGSQADRMLVNAVTRMSVVPSDRRRPEGVLAEAAANASGRQGDAQRGHGWDQIMADIEELLRAGSISESQAEVAVGCATSGDEDTVLQRLRQRYGQEQDVPWLWSHWHSPDVRSRRCCECNGVDDGTPMVQCDNGVMCLKQWFHMACVGMAEPGPLKGGKSAWYLLVSETFS